MSNLSNSSILLVEDEKDIAVCIVKWLNRDSYAVDTAHDGLDALHKINSTNYDLIILDVMLPSLNGIEICRLTRARGDSTPILVLSANCSPATRNAALKSGADMFMVKPFRLRELSANLFNLLQQHQSSSVNVKQLSITCK